MKHDHLRLLRVLARRPKGRGEGRTYAALWKAAKRIDEAIKVGDEHTTFVYIKAHSLQYAEEEFGDICYNLFPEVMNNLHRIKFIYARSPQQIEDKLMEIPNAVLLDDMGEWSEWYTSRYGNTLGKFIRGEACDE